MAATKNATTGSMDDVDRAVANMERSIRRLIALLASEDDGASRKALDALLSRLHPPAAVGFLGEALGRSRGDTRHRRRVATALGAIGRLVREPATTTLIACLLNERDESFAGHLLETLSGLGPAPATSA